MVRVGAGLGIDGIGLVVDDDQLAVVVAVHEVDVTLEGDAVERDRDVASRASADGPRPGATVGLATAARVSAAIVAS